MTIHYAAFDETGRVTVQGTCAADMLVHIAQQHVGAVQVPPEFSYHTHYIDPTTRTPVAYTEAVRNVYAQRRGADYDWLPAQGQWRDKRSVARARVQKWEQIKEARHAAAQVFVWDGSTFDADTESRSRLLLAVQAGAAGVARDWTLADNTTRRMSPADLQAAMRACNDHINTVHARAAALRAQIQTATTLAEVDGIVW